MNETAKRRVAELFSPKPWKHDNTDYPNLDCAKCGAKATYGIDTLFKRDAPCTIPDPIDITDLGKALECFRGIDSPENHNRLEEAIKTVVTREIDEHKSMLSKLKPSDLSDICNLWVLYKATAEQIWEICILAKESVK